MDALPGYSAAETLALRRQADRGAYATVGAAATRHAIDAQRATRAWAGVVRTLVDRQAPAPMLRRAVARAEVHHARAWLWWALSEESDRGAPPSR